MLSFKSKHVISACLIGAGLPVWILAADALHSREALDVPLNVLGINRSPYGEVFAMAMQGPIDTNFHGAMSGGASGHAHAKDESYASSDAQEKNQQGDSAAQQTGATHQGSMLTRLSRWISNLETIHNTRTNPQRMSDAQRYYLRRETENQLRATYQLDPAHYANYNSLHLFLTEPQLGTRPELSASAVQLAIETIQYCLQEKDDPRPLLTAAAACCNLLQLMFQDQQAPNPQFNTTQMRRYLNLLDHCINRYNQMAHQWEVSGQWNRLSQQRLIECAERIHFITRIREASAKAIERFERQTTSHNDHLAR